MNKILLPSKQKANNWYVLCPRKPCSSSRLEPISGLDNDLAIHSLHVTGRRVRRHRSKMVDDDPRSDRCVNMDNRSYMYYAQIAFGGWVVMKRVDEQRSITYKDQICSPPRVELCSPRLLSKSQFPDLRYTCPLNRKIGLQVFMNSDLPDRRIAGAHVLRWTALRIMVFCMCLFITNKI